jgi:acyl dehydratase
VTPAVASSQRGDVSGHDPDPAPPPAQTGHRPAAERPGRRAFPPYRYAVGRENVREYARAVGETDPIHFDLGAARAAGHPDLVAPPMFAAVYCAAAIGAALTDPTLGIDFAMLLHGAQEFSWGPLVHAGDEITTQAELADVSERVGLTFYRFGTRSVNQRDEEVSTGLWTHVVRPRT